MTGDEVTGIAVTPDSRTMFINVQHPGNELARGDRQTPRGHLVVSAPVVFGRTHVAPLLRRYLTRHAEVSADLLLNDRNVHLIEEGVDVAVRIGTLDDSTLVARRLGETRRVVVGAPSYLRKRGKPRRLSDLARHDLIFVTPFHGPREWVFRSLLALIRQKAGKPRKRHLAVSVGATQGSPVVSRAAETSRPWRHENAPPEAIGRWSPSVQS